VDFLEKYTVKQVADRFGVSTHTIRFYDNAGLFPDMARGENGERLFTNEQLEWLHIVMCLRSTGLSIAGIRHYIELSERGDETLEERYQIILEQKERAKAELEESKRKLQVLERKVAWYAAQLARRDQQVARNPA
jgi:DNA-binding transcriptional MerR regulator